jgi:hypothetical protein
MLGDRMPIVLKTTVPSSDLKKNHNAIAYHHARKDIETRMMRFSNILS